MDYSGVVSPGELLLHSRSRMNGYEITLAYRFVITRFAR
jgi:hypothetical protein